MKVIKGQGNPNAKLMVVLDYPSKFDLDQRYPLSGRAGKMFDTILRAYGRSRKDVYITYVYNESNGREESALLTSGGAPSTELMANVLRLIDEINKVNPHCILTMGELSLWALTQRQGVHKYRGSILASTLNERKVVAAVDPNWYFNKFQDHKKLLFEWDVARAIGQSEFPDIRRPETDFIIDPSPSDLEVGVNEIIKADTFAVDTEWYNPDQLAMVGFATSKSFCLIIPYTTQTNLHNIRTLLNLPTPKIMQNGMFDVVALARIGIDVRNVTDDTMVAWKSCYPELEENGLDVIGSVLTEHPYYKDDLKFVNDRSRAGQIYCATDCVVTYEAMDKIDNQEFNYTNGRPGYEISMSLFEPLARSSILGFRCDHDKLDELRKHHLNEADRISKEIQDTVGFTVNCRSSKQVATLVYDILYPEKKVQHRTTEQVALMDLAGTDHKRPDRREILIKIIRVRQNLNIVSRYLNPDKILDRDGRIRTNWRVSGTAGGARMSTSDPWWGGLALQTVPPKARNIFIADHNHVFVGHDLAQAEARYVAVKCRDFELLDDMNKGVDIHTKLASRLPFNLTFEELMELIHQHGKDNVPQRYISKKARHSKNYMGTWKTVMNSINREFLDTGIAVTAAEMKRVDASFMEIHESLPGWWMEVKEIITGAFHDRVLTNCFGRHCHFIGKISDEYIRKAVSWEPQSAIADGTTIAMANVCRRLPYAVAMAHMHDGSLFQVPRDKLEETLQVMNEEMSMEYTIDGHTIIIPADFKVGTVWGEMKEVKV